MWATSFLQYSARIPIRTCCCRRRCRSRRVPSFSYIRVYAELMPKRKLGTAREWPSRQFLPSSRRKPAHLRANDECRFFHVVEEVPTRSDRYIVGAALCLCMRVDG